MESHPQTIGSAIADLEAEIACLRRTREQGDSYELEWRVRELDRLRRHARQACTSSPLQKSVEG